MVGVEAVVEGGHNPKFRLEALSVDRRHNLQFIRIQNAHTPKQRRSWRYDIWL